MTDTDWLSIGKIVGAQGLAGEVRVYPDTDFPERFLPGQRWLRCAGDQEPRPIEILSARYLTNKGLYVLQFEGITHRDQAEALRNCWLCVPEGDRPELDEDEFHVLDLLGLAVVEQATQTPIGTVVDVIAAGNDLLEVELLCPTADPSNNISNPDNIQEDSPPHASHRKSKIKSKRKSIPSKSRILIPFVKAIVPVVDLEQRRLEITPPPGLLES